MTKKWKQCKHENLYSQRTSLGKLGQPNGLIRMPGRSGIKVDHCRDCQHWIYDGMPFLTIMHVEGYVGAVDG